MCDKNLTFSQNQGRRSYRAMARTITLQFQPNKLESKLKRETFPKLGLGISEIDKRMSWRRRRGGLPKLLLLIWRFGART